MKAKYFKRLRKRIKSLQNYQVRESAVLFGDFFGSNRLCLILDDTQVSATSPLRAIKIYMRNYRKTRKKKNEHERVEYYETIEKWGNLMITDQKGFRTFY